MRPNIDDPLGIRALYNQQLPGNWVSESRPAAGRWHTHTHTTRWNIKRQWKCHQGGGRPHRSPLAIVSDGTKTPASDAFIRSRILCGYFTELSMKWEAAVASSSYQVFFFLSSNGGSSCCRRRKKKGRAYSDPVKEEFQIKDEGSWKHG